MMWSFYTGQLPYVFTGEDVRPNRLFPLFPPTAHRAYVSLAEGCLRRDPHERPSFTDIAKSLVAIFRSELSEDEGRAIATATGRHPRPDPATLWGGQEASTSILLSSEEPAMSSVMAAEWEGMTTTDFSVSRGLMASTFLGSGRHATSTTALGQPPQPPLCEQQQKQL